MNAEAIDNSKPWWNLIDLGKLDQDLRRRLLERLVSRLGVVRAARLLVVDRSLVYRMCEDMVSMESTI